MRTYFLSMTMLFLGSLSCVPLSFLALSCPSITDVDKSTDSISSFSSGSASFSCKIDGKDFSGKGTDELAANVAFKMVGGRLNFVLVPIIRGQKGIPPQMKFSSILNKGKTIAHGTTDNRDYTVVYSRGNAVDNDYTCKEMIVEITASGNSRVTGTFSGTLIEPKTDRDITVIDGKFDIPYSPYSKQ